MAKKVARLSELFAFVPSKQKGGVFKKGKKVKKAKLEKYVNWIYENWENEKIFSIDKQSRRWFKKENGFTKNKLVPRWISKPAWQHQFNQYDPFEVLKRQFLEICKRRKIKVNEKDFSRGSQKRQIVVRIKGEKRDYDTEKKRFSKWYTIEYVDRMTRLELVEFVVKQNNRQQIALEMFGEKSYGVVVKKFEILFTGKNATKLSTQRLKELSFIH